MKCLVVVAHPLQNSLSKNFSDKIIERLVALGHEVEIEDLYRQKFEPVLSKQERLDYYENDYSSPLLAKQMKRLSETEALILVFPTWWFGFPAILKGWVDRVWVPDVAYKHSENFGPIEPNLHKLKHTLVVTSLGSPWWIDRLIMFSPVKRIVKIAMLGACAKNSKLDFLSLYNSEKLDEQKIVKFTHRIENIINSWKR